MNDVTELDLLRKSGRLRLEYSDLVHLWGSSHLRILNSELSARLRLPSWLEQLSKNPGLPADPGSLIDSLPHAEQRDFEPRIIAVKGIDGTWLQFASDAERAWCVDLEHRTVVFFSPEVNGYGVYVNSTLDLFIEFLARLQLWRNVCRGRDDRAAKNELDRLENLLAERDPPAFTDQARFWPSFIQDIKWQLTWV